MTAAGPAGGRHVRGLSESIDAREGSWWIRRGRLPATLLDRLANLDPQERREVATIVRGLSETVAEVPDGKTTSHVLGVLAHLLDPS